jgi:hypothetical protein
MENLQNEWQCVAVLNDDEDFYINGINIKNSKYIDTHIEVEVKDPSYGQKYITTIKKIDIKNCTIEFLSVEFSNYVYGLYLKDNYTITKAKQGFLTIKFNTIQHSLIIFNVNIMKIIYSIIALYLVISCKTSKEKIVLEVKNNELHYCINEDSLDYYNAKKYFPNKKEKEKSTNLVKLSIKNATSKNYLFLVGDFELVDNTCLEMNVYEDGKKTGVVRSYPQYEFETRDEVIAWETCLKYESANRHAKDNLLSREGFNTKGYKYAVFDFPNQNIVIHANESRLLYYSLKLPYVTEKNIYGLFSPKSFFFKKGSKYEFSITYKMEKGLEENLPKEVIDNLKENNIEIFHGKIESNKIPIINNYN